MDQVLLEPEVLTDVAERNLVDPKHIAWMYVVYTAADFAEAFDRFYKGSTMVPVHCTVEDLENWRDANPDQFHEWALRAAQTHRYGPKGGAEMRLVIGIDSATLVGGNDSNGRVVARVELNLAEARAITAVFKHPLCANTAPLGSSGTSLFRAIAASAHLKLPVWTATVHALGGKRCAPAYAVHALNYAEWKGVVVRRAVKKKQAEMVPSRANPTEPISLLQRAAQDAATTKRAMGQFRSAENKAAGAPFKTREERLRAVGPCAQEHGWSFDQCRPRADDRELYYFYSPAGCRFKSTRSAKIAYDAHLREFNASPLDAVSFFGAAAAAAPRARGAAKRTREQMEEETPPFTDAELLAKIGKDAETLGWTVRKCRRTNGKWQCDYYAPGSKKKYSKKRGVIEYNKRAKEGARSTTLHRFFEKKGKS